MVLKRNIDNLILTLDTICVSCKKTASKAAALWQKTQFSNLIRYKPSGTYFARVRVKGKLIRKTLKTDTLSVAKLRLGDLEKFERQSTLIRGCARLRTVLETWIDEAEQRTRLLFAATDAVGGTSPDARRAKPVRQATEPAKLSKGRPSPVMVHDQLGAITPLSSIWFFVDVRIGALGIFHWFLSRRF